VPVDRADALQRVRDAADGLMSAVLAADPRLDGFYAGESVLGLISQEYEGRAVAELLQNAHDQLKGRGRIHVLLCDDDGGMPVLYVANDGRPFSDDDFDSILRIAASTKHPGSWSIGYKGVGFKAVFPLSSSAEIYSSAAAPGPTFDGYRFRLGTREDLAANMGESDAAVFVARLPASALAIPLPEDRSPVVAEFSEAGYATVVRVALDQVGARDRVLAELQDLTTSGCPPHLFLECLSILTVERRGTEPMRVEMSRITRPWIGGTLQADLVDLGSSGTFLCVRREVDHDGLHEAAQQSVDRNEVDRRWLEVAGPLGVEVAVRIDSEPEPGRLYAFLPMSVEEVAPLAGHINAPFATRLARDRVRFDVPLNALFLREAANAAVDAAQQLKTAATDTTRALVATLIAWWGPQASVARDALSTVSDDGLVPAIHRHGQTWIRLPDTMLWKDEGLGRLQSHYVASISSALLADPKLGVRRLAGLERAALDMYGHHANPDPATTAGWIEEIAVALKGGRSAAAAWLEFYDDLAVIFAATPSALEGRRILLTEEGDLAECGGRGRILAGRSRPVVFFPATLGTVGDEGEEEGPGVHGRVPSSFSRRIAFMHHGLTWTTFNRETRAREMRPSREFLAAKQLVRPYQAEDVLLLVRDIVRDSNDRRIHADALRFVLAQARGRGLPAEPPLASLGLRVPTKSGRWIRASEATFSAEWPGTNGQLLEQVLEAWDDDASMQRIRETLIAPPDVWPTHRLPRPDEAWTAFLRQLGVRDGLSPNDAKRTSVTGAGWEFGYPDAIAGRVSLGSAIAADWVEHLHVAAKVPYYTTVAYEIDGPVSVLPGHERHSEQTEVTRLLYGRLLAASLGRWPDAALEVRIRRPAHAPTRDVVTWPSPAATFVARQAWLPIALPRLEPGTGARAEQVSTPSSAWLVEDDPREQTPSFVPLISLDVRRRIASDDSLRRRLAAAGMRVWGRPSEALSSLTLMADSFEEYGVLEGLELRLKQAYQQAWAQVVKRGEPWPSADVPTHVLASRGEDLECVDLTPDEAEVWVLVAGDRLTETLLRAVGRPVLVASASDGAAIQELLAQRWGHRVVPVLPGDSQVVVDGSVVIPSSEQPRLVEVVGSWLAEFVALTLQLRRPQFTRQSERTLRDALDSLRRIRLVEAREFGLRVKGLDVPTPPIFLQAVPADDEVAPTLVARATTTQTWAGLRDAMPAIAELAHQPQFASPLRDVLVDLARITGTDEVVPPTADEYAAAFLESADRVRAVLADQRGSLDDLLRMLRPVIAVLADVEDALAFTASGDAASVLAALSEVPAIGGSAAAIFDCAVIATDLADLRDRLQISISDFNDGLRQLGPPYRPIRYDDGAWKALETWLLQHRGELFDSLRAAFGPQFSSLGSILPYQRAAQAIDALSTPAQRNRVVVEGLAPDASWAETYSSPPPAIVGAHVARWLGTFGAALGETYAPPSRDQMRDDNVRLVSQLLPDLATTVAAWATLRGMVEPPEWTRAPLSLRDRLAGEGWLDFAPGDFAWLVRWLVVNHLWPTSMPPSHELSNLHLTPDDLAAMRTEADRRRAEEMRRRRTVVLDEQPVSTDDGTEAVVGRILAGIEANPPRAGKLRISHLQPMPKTETGGVRGGGGGGGRGSDRGLSDDQKTLIGLIGEIAAYDWLDRTVGMTPQFWRSTNRSSRFPGDPGDDSLGFDMAIPDSPATRYIEVKATTGDGSDASIELSTGEAKFARSQIRGRRYNILLVTNVLDSPRRRFYLLPNPFAPEAVDLYRVRNRGFRFSFRL